MKRIVVGGQLEKKDIAQRIEAIGRERVEVTVMNDLDAVMAVKNGTQDYYFGACATGSGGALAMAIALLGSGQTVTVARPGKIAGEAEIREAVQNGAIAYGFTADAREQVIPVLMDEILKGEK